MVFSVQSNIGTEAIKWVRLVDGSENQLGIQSSANAIEGSRAFEVAVTDNADAGIYIDAFVEYLVDLSEVPAFVNELLLAERNYLGTYFDGDTVRGGWLIDSSSISDYRWDDDPDDSVSIFAEDYERTKHIIDELLPLVVPVTEESKYHIIAYNAHRTSTWPAVWGASHWNGPATWG